MPAVSDLFLRCQRSSVFFLVAYSAALGGLPGLWRVPDILSSPAASAYLLVYAAALVLMGWPLLAGQILIGRGQHRDLAGVISSTARPGRAGGAWQVITIAAWLGCLLLLAIFFVLASWALAYLGRALTQQLVTGPPEATRAAFNGFVRDGERGLGWLLLIVALVAASAARGVRRAVLPALALAAVLIGLLIVTGVVFAPASVLHDGVVGWLGQRPDFVALGVAGASAALLQAFMALSLGSGAVIALASRLPRNGSVFLFSAAVMLVNLALTLVLAAVTLAWLGPGGVPQMTGLESLFVFLPSQLSGGVLVAVYSMVLLIVIAVCLGLMLPLLDGLSRRLNMSPAAAALTVAITAGLLALLLDNSLGVLSRWTLAGHDLFSGAILIATRGLLPLAGLGFCVLIVRGSAPAALLARWRPQPSSIQRRGFMLWHGWLCFPARLLLVAAVFEAVGGRLFVQWLW